MVEFVIYDKVLSDLWESKENQLPPNKSGQLHYFV